MELTTTVNVPSANISPKSVLHRTIKTLLGQHVHIVDAKVSPLIRNDSTIPVVVKYVGFPINLAEHYYVERGSLKQVAPNSVDFITTINGVKVQLREFNDQTKYIPINITPIVVAVQSDDSPLTYKGEFIREPLSYLCVPLHRSPYRLSHPFDMPSPKKLYPETWTPPPSQYTKEKTVTSYEYRRKTFKILNQTENTQLVETFDKCVPSTSAYVIQFAKIPRDKPLRGIILLIPQRLDDYVLFYPCTQYEITTEELDSLVKFFADETIRYNNYCYMMSAK